MLVSRLVTTRQSDLLKNGASVRYTLEVKLDIGPKKYQPYGWLKSRHWSNSLDGLVGWAGSQQIWMHAGRRLPPHDYCCGGPSGVLRRKAR